VPPRRGTLDQKSPGSSPGGATGSPASTSLLPGFFTDSTQDRAPRTERSAPEIAADAEAGLCARRVPNAAAAGRQSAMTRGGRDEPSGPHRVRVPEQSLQTDRRRPFAFGRERAPVPTDAPLTEVAGELATRAPVDEAAFTAAAQRPQPTPHTAPRAARAVQRPSPPTAPPPRARSTAPRLRGPRPGTRTPPPAAPRSSR